ncbi:MULTISPECIES: Crp/Fnr family transcriptional regulator [unclassified Paraburkholderia]|uniref:Crp/Fnr family transcriptional regulator n=1 Tax=unclassified Paraburkholderia TaxID=2615204 RepID=UPI000E25D230|nr:MULTISPECIES: Crp/Fnr family transcriptional regulator [unclassified Paraburkholderia]REE22640.1 CRP-like cAMP-binding protein [Paraburkholderia sp. BL27I4N3]RKR36835.1 CRP-like cAMP-binding protein [Paraburkholderia sp. BL17N1]
MHSSPSTSLLREQWLFQNASEDVLARVRRCARYRKVKARDIVVHHGDSDSPLFLVISGQLHASSVSEAGHETGYSYIKAGESFGESAIILDTPVLASVTALTSGVVGVISRAQARELFCDASVAVALLSILSGKFHRAVRGQSTLSMPRAFSRVYAIINAALDESPDGTQPLIELPNQTAIATSANVSRETVSRAMKSLMQRGAVIKEGQRLRVLDRSIFSGLALADETLDDSVS